MPDYGHDLIFGTFLTPRTERSEDVIALAQLTERVELDLVTFQDHPYQPAFLDTWTLLSYVAASTERVRLAGNVLNLPLRPPAVLARAAASLDLLSNGRLELGLGSGSFWEAIAAMGGPRRTPGEAVTALEEAIDVIRAVWAPEERGAVRVDGQQYQVAGAKRGPRPAHDIAIWVGALRPRMLALIGRKADGWLPSLSYLQPGDLRRGNEVIDEAAAAAGRDPRQVRRLLNIGLGDDGVLAGAPSQWAGRLLPFAVEDGISAFILAADEPGLIEAWGREAAPELRAAVARERASGLRA
jgi:alkanesulfonate monooxygenase SsuD/methylene tetrahydromethanopterin reductase-like flavin-dependent oxidoreductase (luciferase family)